MSDSSLFNNLSKRERQVVEIIVRTKKATARDVERELADPPSYSAVRSILRILVSKKVLAKKRIDQRDWYSCCAVGSNTKAGVIRALVQNFFNDSAGEAACALLGQKNVILSDKEAQELMKLIENARAR